MTNAGRTLRVLVTNLFVTTWFTHDCDRQGPYPQGFIINRRGPGTVILKGFFGVRRNNVPEASELPFTISWVIFQSCQQYLASGKNRPYLHSTLRERVCSQDVQLCRATLCIWQNVPQICPCKMGNVSQLCKWGVGRLTARYLL